MLQRKPILFNFTAHDINVYDRKRENLIHTIPSSGNIRTLHDGRVDAVILEDTNIFYNFTQPPYFEIGSGELTFKLDFITGMEGMPKDKDFLIIVSSLALTSIEEHFSESLHYFIVPNQSVKCSITDKVLGCASFYCKKPKY
jgi:hypothetical protein